MAITSPGAIPASRSCQRRLSSAGGRKCPSLAQVGAEGMIDRTGHVAGDGVQRLDGAGKALRRARIHEQTLRVLERFDQLGGA